MSDRAISRRGLLLGSAASAALAACGRSATSGGGVGFAVVGIGSLTAGQVIPALAKTRSCYLAGLVSSSTDKMREIGARYGVPEAAQYGYDDFDRIAENPDVQAVYIGVPNALHAEFAVRAARAGKHVLCEKPLAVSVEQGEAMVAASRAAGKHLAVAYRLQFSPHHQELARLARERVFGSVRYVRANIGFGIGDDWRLSRELAGGGVLLEQGVYAVQMARSLVGMNPVEVYGHEIKSDSARFSDVDESVLWTMTFSSGAVAHCAASYTMPMNRVWCGADRGAFELEPAYNYDGLKGKSTAGSIDAANTNQFVAQFDDFVSRVREGVSPDANSGEEGLRDVRIIQAIYDSIRQGSPVAVT